MRQRVIVVTFFTLGLFIILAAIFFSYHSNNSKKPSSQTSNTANTIQPPSFNEDTLLNRGVTSQQLSNMDQALGQYLNSQNKTPGQVSFSLIERTPPNPNATAPFSELTFVVQLDGKDAYKAKLDSFSLSEIRLYLYTLDGNKLLYDSQNIGSSQD